MALFLAALFSGFLVTPAVVPSSTGNFRASDLRLQSGLRLEDQFRHFMIKYQKTYVPGTSEYKRRLALFGSALERIEWLNHHRVHPKSAMYGITSFSDLSTNEFQNKVIGRNWKRDPISKNKSIHGKRPKRHIYANSLIEKLPQDFPRRVDWREKGVIAEVHNQGKCGACWAYSTVETVESMVAIKTNKDLVQLSVQQVIDCSSDTNYGCDGGDTCAALAWMVDYKIKLQTARDYPMRDDAGPCRAKKPSTGIVVVNYTCDNFTMDENKMLNQLAFHGPVAAAVDATSWQDYLGGIIQFHCENNRNHAVQVVGYDLTGEVPYYIVKNTWGTVFGIDGYLHVAIGKNLCGIVEEVSSVDLLF